MAMNREQERGMGMADQIQTTLRGQRRRVEELAQLLSQQSIQQWQRAVEGIVALPAALVTGAAASTLYAVGFVTRGLEVFEETIGSDRDREARLYGTRGTRGEIERREGNERGDVRGEQQQLNPNAPRA